MINHHQRETRYYTDETWRKRFETRIIIMPRLSIVQIKLVADRPMHLDEEAYHDLLPIDHET